MTSEPDDLRTEQGSAEAVFAAWAVRVENGEALAFEELLQAHPAHSEELSKLHEDWKLFAPLLGKVVPGLIASSSGIKVAPLSGGDDDDPGMPSAELLDRLGIHAPNTGRYRFRAVLGRGGGGVVLKVWDTKLNRPLAMKVVMGRGEERPTGDTPKVDSRTLTRFVDEARIASQLNHPGIVPVHELGADESGRAFFTMKLVKGEDLSKIFEHVKTGHDGWNQTRALGVLLKVCEAMSFAHAKGVIHRDLKPANVMVGRYGEVHVMDWGLARVLGEKDHRDLRIRPPERASASAVDSLRGVDREGTPNSPLITMDGAIVGTPAYMSPEQARGDLDAVGPRSDVYAIGAMLYELVTSQVPYVPSGARVSPHTILNAVLRGAPAPVESLASATPAELVAICERAMKRESLQRYADTLGLSSDLRAYIEGRVVAAYESGPWAETRKWVQRNKPLAGSLAAALFVLVLGLVMSLVLTARADESANLAEARRVESEHNALRADSEAEEANRLKNEAVTRDRESRVRGLISDVALFNSLEDDLEYARKHPRPVSQWWLERAHELVDGVEEDLARGRSWSPGCKDVETAIAALRLRARERTPEDIEHDRVSCPLLKEYGEKSTELDWLSRMLGLRSWPEEEDVEAELSKQSLPTDPYLLQSAAWKLIDPKNPPSGREVEAVLLARRAVAAADLKLAAALTELTSRAPTLSIDEWVDSRSSFEDSGSGLVSVTMKLVPWSAAQAVGPPDADSAKDDPAAWTYLGCGGTEWLELDYDPPLRGERIRIYEVNNSGKLTEVQALHADRSVRTLWEGNDPTARPGVFEIQVEPAEYVIVRLRLTLDGQECDKRMEIDAVEVSGPDGAGWAASASASSSYADPFYFASGEINTPNSVSPKSNRDEALRTRGVALQTLAWALYRTRRFEEGIARERDAVGVHQQLGWGTSLFRGGVERAISNWNPDNHARRRAEHDALAASVAQIGDQIDKFRTWHFAESQDEWWHARIVELKADLEDLRHRIAVVEKSVAMPEALERWGEAILAIAGSPKYGGLRLAPQIDLFPIGPDPDSGLWEFAHLGTGEPAARGLDGRIAMKPETGIVFVLLPGGRVPVEVGKEPTSINSVDLDPFFLSKYEMTVAQWNRVSQGTDECHYKYQPLLPASGVTWDACVALLDLAGSFLRLPTDAQWEYGCRASTTTRYWTGPTSDSLQSAECLDGYVENHSFGSGALDRDPQSVGDFHANPFGLHDVHGNAWEWCRDFCGGANGTVPENAPLRNGDGEREVTDPTDRALRVVRGGFSASSAGYGSSGNRYGKEPSTRDPYGGLRVARCVTP